MTELLKAGGQSRVARKLRKGTKCPSSDTAVLEGVVVLSAVASAAGEQPEESGQRGTCTTWLRFSCTGFWSLGKITPLYLHSSIRC